MWMFIIHPFWANVADATLNAATAVKKIFFMSTRFFVFFF